MACLGTSDTHCCWLQGQVCPYLEQYTMPDRRWACALMREYNDWDLVIASDRYQADVAPILGPMGITCKEWPRPDQVCHDCGHGVE